MALMTLSNVIEQKVRKKQKRIDSWLTSGIEGSYSSGEMDVAKQGFSTLPCQSSHHVLYQLPQRSGKARKKEKLH